MALTNIIIGLLGMGIIVFVHELGHFLAAKSFGVTVEAFSLGWGPKLVGFTKNGTEYRISALPLGGYCRMKGESLFRKALDEDLDAIPFEEGSLFSVSPIKRLITYLAGPMFNLIFAIIVLSVIHGAGFNIYTYSNQIVLASDYQQSAEPSAADRGGIASGDRIIAIDDHKVNHYRDIQEIIARSAEKELSITVLRDGEEISLTITPDLNPKTGAGYLGVAAWVEPVIHDVKKDSAAAIAGLKSGDRIVSANGRKISHQMDLAPILAKNTKNIELKVERDGETVDINLIPHYSEEKGYDLGFALVYNTVRSQASNPFAAVKEGWNETWSTLSSAVSGFGMLFKGIDLQNALSGPLKITYMVGEITTAGFESNLEDGFVSFFRFLSMLSVVLFFMNLLPIPALDGGMIVAGLWEVIRRKPLHPKKFYRYQMIGFSVILLLALFITMNDLLFFFRE